MHPVVRGSVAVSAFLAASLISTVVRADAEAECRSGTPARVVPGCTERLQAPNLTVPQRVAALQYRSWAHTDMKAFEAAEADVNEIFKIEPNSPIGYGARGRLRHFLGNNDLALNDYNQSVALAQNKYSFLLNRGLFFIRTSNFDPARSDYEAAMALDPKKAAPYLGRAKVHRNKNNDDAALKDLDTAISLEPELAPSYLERGELLLAMRDPRRALADFDKALALLKTSSRATRGRESALGMMSPESGGASKPSQPPPTQPTATPSTPPQAPASPTTPKPVQPASTPATPTAPTATAADTDEQLKLAAELRKAKKRREALEIYNKLLAANPENFGAMFGRAATFEEEFQFNPAIEGYQSLRGNSKAPPEYRLAATEAMTRILTKVGDFEVAIALADEALKMNPKSEDALFWGGLSKLRQFRYAGAIADFQRLPSPEPAWEGYARAALGEHAAALALADAVTKANDKASLPYVTRARVALAKGDIATAEAQMKLARDRATTPESTHTDQLILIAKLMKPSDAPISVKRD